MTDTYKNLQVDEIRQGEVRGMDKMLARSLSIAVISLAAVAIYFAS